jgi:hypothetical protein
MSFDFESIPDQNQEEEVFSEPLGDPRDMYNVNSSRSYWLRKLSPFAIARLIKRKRDSRDHTIRCSRHENEEAFKQFLEMQYDRPIRVLEMIPVNFILASMGVQN